MEKHPFIVLLLSISRKKQFGVSIAGIDLEADPVPDETTILTFRHYLEEHRLTEKIFGKTKEYLADRGLLLREGTIINAPS